MRDGKKPTGGNWVMSNEIGNELGNGTIQSIDDGAVYVDENIWLTQKMMGLLYRLSEK
jgi:hypothetical protein